MAQQGIASRIARGVRLAGSWRVECVLQDDEEPSAVLARSDEGRRAVCFLLGAAAAPDVDPVAASAWGTSRSVLVDDEHGTIVVDAVGLDARPLAAVEADRPDLARRARARIEEVARAEHGRGSGHGRIRRELVFVTDGSAVHVCGWALGPRDRGDSSQRDLEDVGLLLRDPAGGPSSGWTAPSLSAAIRSENIETLRRALAHAGAPGSTVTADERARAEDALSRMETHIEACLARAERQLGVRDPLGAVAACREAVRLGAGPRAERLLKRARRQAKELLAPPSASRAIWPAAAVAAAAALVVLVIAFAWMRGDDSAELRDAVERVAAERGERAAFQMLVAAADREPADVSRDDLAERLARLVSEERQTVLRLRREAISDGMRPRQADEVAEESLQALDALKNSIGHPAFSTRLARVLARVDRASALYRARTSLAADDAAAAVDQLVALDPAFVPRGGQGGRR